MKFRRATSADCALLAEKNLELIRDEGHRNPMTAPELEARLRNWLVRGEYAAILFEDEKGFIGYALYREQPAEIYLRHFFIERCRRRLGFGRRALELLRSQLWPRNRRFTVEVLTANHAAVQFWRAVGFVDYSLSLEILPPKTA
jgi:GNAT superfamily N-acetyltransferase